MRTPKAIALEMPKFANERDEADWWASQQGRKFLASQPAARPKKSQAGSKLVAKLAKPSTVQIALRLPSPDLDRAKRIAERKGIGYQTLLKMLIHEGLERTDRGT